MNTIQRKLDDGTPYDVVLPYFVKIDEHNNQMLVYTKLKNIQAANLLEKVALDPAWYIKEIKPLDMVKGDWNVKIIDSSDKKPKEATVPFTMYAREKILGAGGNKVVPIRSVQGMTKPPQNAQTIERFFEKRNQENYDIQEMKWGIYPGTNRVVKIVDTKSKEIVGRCLQSQIHSYLEAWQYAKLLLGEYDIQYPPPFKTQDNAFNFSLKVLFKVGPRSGWNEPNQLIA